MDKDVRKVLARTCDMVEYSGAIVGRADLVLRATSLRDRLGQQSFADAWDELFAHMAKPASR